MIEEKEIFGIYFTLLVVNIGKVLVTWLFLAWLVEPFLKAYGIVTPPLDFYMAFAGLMFVKLVLLNKIY